MTISNLGGDLLTVDEALQLLKISRSLLHQYVRRGELKAVKFGRATRFRRPTLDAFVLAHETAAEPAGLVAGLARGKEE